MYSSEKASFNQTLEALAQQQAEKRYQHQIQKSQKIISELPSISDIPTLFLMYDEVLGEKFKREEMCMWLDHIQIERLNRIRERIVELDRKFQYVQETNIMEMSVQSHFQHKDVELSPLKMNKQIGFFMSSSCYQNLVSFSLSKVHLGSSEFLTCLALPNLESLELQDVCLTQLKGLPKAYIPSLKNLKIYDCPCLSYSGLSQTELSDLEEIEFIGRLGIPRQCIGCLDKSVLCKTSIKKSSARIELFNENSKSMVRRGVRIYEHQQKKIKRYFPNLICSG